MADVGVNPPPDIQVYPSDDSSQKISSAALQIWAAGVNAYLTGIVMEGM
jgi:hypothetical protein